MAQGRVTTHVLNTSTGTPATGLAIDVYRLHGDKHELVKHLVTNADGRTDQPTLDGDDFMVGVYEFCFHAGDYLEKSGLDAPAPLFLDIIPVRFGVAHEDRHYHVPLLLSPYGYSTYRGS